MYLVQHNQSEHNYIIIIGNNKEEMAQVSAASRPAAITDHLLLL